MDDILKCTPEQVTDLREIRKLLNILQTMGNVIVPGNIHAQTKFTFLVSGFIDNGFTTNDISTLIDNLDKAGYPAIINQ